MTRSSITICTMLTILASFLLIPAESHAIPAFARQTLQPCTSCHTQHFPTLNAFGRMFKAQGFTMIAQPQVMGNGLELPVSLNMALVGALQYVNGAEGSELGFPAALSIYLAGKAGDKAGYVMEIPFGALMGSDENSPAVAQFGSFKMNYIDQLLGVNVGAIGFSTGMAGPAYGYELMSTGAMGMNVAQTGSNAMGAIGLHMEHGATLMSKFMSKMDGMAMSMAGKATGGGLSVQNDTGYLYYAAYVPQQKIEHIEDPKPASYLRAVWTPMLGGFDTGIGTQLYFGKTTIDGMSVDAIAYSVDFQAQGEVFAMPLGLYTSVAMAPSSGSTKNYYNMSNGGDNKSFGILGELGVYEKVSVSIGYAQADYWMGTDSMAPGMGMGSMPAMAGPMSGMSSAMKQFGTATSAGMEYLFRPNVRMAARVTKFGGDFDETTTVLTIYAGL